MFTVTKDRKLQQLVFILPLILILNACGGGSDSGQYSTASADSTPPTVRIKFPGLNAITEKNTVLVRGVANDDSAITYLAVNGVEATTSDGYANWQVTVPLQRGDNTLAVEVRDEFSNTDTAAASLQVVSIDRIMYEPTRMALDAANNRLFVIDRTRTAVFEVDTVTGQRRIFSDATTPDALQPFSNPTAIALDTVNNRLLVADSGRDALFAVDMATGSRSIVSGSSVKGELRLDDPLFADLVINPSTNIAYYSNLTNDSIISIDLATGERTIFANDTIPAGANPLIHVGALALDMTNARLLVGDYKDVLAIDLETGQRSVFSAHDPVKDRKTVIRGMFVDETNNRVLVSRSGSNATREEVSDVIAIDLSTGVRTEPTNYTASPYLQQFDIVFDVDSNRALFSNQSNNEIVSVHLSSNVPSVLSGIPKIPSTSSANLIHASDIVVDAVNNRALIADLRLVTSSDYSSKIIAMDLDSGARTVFSDNSTPDALNIFGSISGGLEVDNINNRLLAFDWRSGVASASVLSVNLSTGARTILSSGTIPDANLPMGWPPKSLVIDHDNNRILALHGYSETATITAIDSSTGARSILSDPLIPSAAVPFHDPQALAIDTANGQVLVADGNTGILAVDLSTGKRTLLSDIAANDILVDTETNRVFIFKRRYHAHTFLEMDLTNGNITEISPPSTPDTINALLGSFGFTLDNKNNRFLATSQTTHSIYAIDIPSGERIIVSH